MINSISASLGIDQTRLNFEGKETARSRNSLRLRAGLFLVLTGKRLQLSAGAGSAEAGGTAGEPSSWRYWAM